MTHFSTLRFPVYGFICVALVFALPAYGQEVPTNDQDRELETQFMMLNQHVCPLENMEEVMSMVEDHLVPILDEMDADGEINDWGILTHAWGDEYNFNFFMVTDDHRAFLDAWDSFGQRSDERDPDWFQQWLPLCTLHKDNMYMLHRYGPADTDQ